MVLSYSDETGKRVTKSFTTHLKEKGNKKQAEAMLMELRRKATAEQQLKKKSGDICFDTYLENWLLKLKPKVSPTTFVAYSHNVRSVCRYFGDRQMPILELSPVDLTGYYDALLQRGLSPTTVRRHHANIHKALKQAVSEGLIAFNPADRVELPPLERYQAQFYSAEECQMLVNAVKDTSIELPVVLTLLLGLRRSEVLGLQWESVDFERHTIHICRSTHQIESELVTRKVLKRKSSYRTLPMPSEVESRLKQESRWHTHHTKRTERTVSEDSPAAWAKAYSLSRPAPYLCGTAPCRTGAPYRSIQLAGAQHRSNYGRFIWTS